MEVNVQSWYEGFKATLKNWYAKLNLSNDRLIEIAGYFIVGFISGFLFKKSIRFLFFFLLIFIIAIVLMDSFGLININWNNVRELTGIGPSDTVGGIFSNFLHWIKINIVMVLSAFIGFLIGYMIG